MEGDTVVKAELGGVKSLSFGRFDRYTFLIDGKPLSVTCPPKPLSDRCWAWVGEFMDSVPEVQIPLLENGFYTVYLGFPDQFGGPEAVRRWNDVYALLTERHGFSRKAALIGVSRGGLYCYQWAIANPRNVACIYGDAPVCDLRSWPGGKGRGTGSPEEWRKALAVFGFGSESEAMASDRNPVDNLAPLALAQVPILHVYGDADEAVPWEENTGVLAERYRRLGGRITLIAKPGCGHHPHGLEDPTPIVDFILRYSLRKSAS
jgi:pimeloyl-ACP methyl ester carboxylesterase